MVNNQVITGNDALTASAASGSTTALMAGLSVNDWFLIIGLIISILSFLVGLFFRFAEYRRAAKSDKKINTEDEIKQNLDEVKETAENIIKLISLLKKIK